VRVPENNAMSQRPETGGNIVCVMAHPDDMSNSMGGTAWLLKDRYPLHVLCATRGERGIRDKTYEEAAAIREKEEAAASALLGAHLTFLDRVNGELYADREICERAAAIFRELQPLAVFTLWPINRHEDHTTVYEIALKALHLADLADTVEVYMSENGMGGQTNQFEPDLYVNISAVVEQKAAMVRCHVSQNQGDADRVLERNRIRGLLAGCEYAEGFKTLRPVMTGRWGRRSGSILLDL